MPILSLLGNSLISFGPAIALFVVYFAHHPSLGLLALASAFFALVALLLAASLWLLVPNRVVLSIKGDISSETLIPAIFTVFIVSLVQELVRVGLCVLVRKAEGGIILASGVPVASSHYHRLRIASAIGYGWATLVALLTQIQSVIESAGPGMRLSPSCPSIPDVFISSLATLLMFIHQLVWTGLTFHALLLNRPVPGSTPAPTRPSSTASPGGIGSITTNILTRPTVILVYVTVSHLIVSFSSLLQRPSISGSCVFPLVISAGVLVASAFLSIGAVHMALKKAL